MMIGHPYGIPLPPAATPLGVTLNVPLRQPMYAEESHLNHNVSALLHSSSNSNSTALSSSEPKKRRLPKACAQCRLIKRRCDGQSPCSRCVGRGIADTCTYVPRRKRSKVPRLSSGEGEANSTHDQSLSSRNPSRDVMSDDDAGNEGQCDEEEESDSDSGSPSETESPGSSRQAQPHSASYAQSSVHSSGSSGISTNYSSSIAAKAPSALLSASSQFQANIQPSASSSSGSAFHPPSSSSAGIQLTPLGFSAAGGQSPIFGLTSPAAWPSFDFFSDFAAVTEASVSAAAASSSSSSSSAAAGAGAAATPGASSAGSSYNLEETLSRLSVDQRFRHLPILAYLVKLTQRRTIDVSAVQMLVDHLQHLQWPQTELLNPANDLDSMVARDVMLRHHVEDCSHLVQTSVFPALMIANHGRIYRYNSALVELSPFTRDELERPDFEPLELFDEECAPGMIRFIMQRKDNKKLVSGSLRVILKRKDGRKVEYCAGVTLLRDMSGNLVGTTTIFVPLPT